MTEEVPRILSYNASLNEKREVKPPPDIAIEPFELYEFSPDTYNTLYVHASRLAHAAKRRMR